tara:strand:- start:84942 stop:85661 length:720 start_codon:yes stop_codon:yes gene_type:complete
MRSFNRKTDEIRPINIKSNIITNADGSCEIKVGNTIVICTASYDLKTPYWLRGSNKGWLSAEYGMLPRSTNDRMSREAKFGKQSGRTQEIQRLIGRSLRSCLNLNLLDEKQIIIDCDVIQADGGTRTASITGGWVALAICINKMMKTGLIEKNPIKSQIAAISCGIVNNELLLDLDYDEDSEASVDANFVFTKDFKLVEVQSSAEENTFDQSDIVAMLGFVMNSKDKIIKSQNEAISNL